MIYNRKRRHSYIGGDSPEVFERVRYVRSFASTN